MLKKIWISIEPTAWCINNHISGQNFATLADDTSIAQCHRCVQNKGHRPFFGQSEERIIALSCMEGLTEMSVPDDAYSICLKPAPLCTPLCIECIDLIKDWWLWAWLHDNFYTARPIVCKYQSRSFRRLSCIFLMEPTQSPRPTWPAYGIDIISEKTYSLQFT